MLDKFVGPSANYLKEKKVLFYAFLSVLYCLFMLVILNFDVISFTLGFISVMFLFYSFQFLFTKNWQLHFYLLSFSYNFLNTYNYSIYTTYNFIFKVLLVHQHFFLQTSFHWSSFPRKDFYLTLTCVPFLSKYMHRFLIIVRNYMELSIKKQVRGGCVLKETF